MSRERRVHVTTDWGSGAVRGTSALQGFPSLRVEEIFRRTKGSKSAELGYYDWCVNLTSKLAREEW